MSPKANLNDLQLILLATAIQREDGSVLPVPESVGSQAERIRKAVPPLLRRKLITEVPVTDFSKTWRQEDQQRIGLAITPAGRTIIATGEPEAQAPGGASVAPAHSGPADASPPTSPRRAGSKIETVLGLLRSNEGATLASMVEATGWLPHTTRAALTGLRKKGYVITKTRRDDVTLYQIAQAEV